MVAAGALAGCDAGAPCPVDGTAAVIPIDTGYFVDISAQSGIEPGSEEHPRLGFADLDGDGFDDIVLHRFVATTAMPYDHRVLLSNGNGTFRDGTEASGLGAVQAAFFVFGDVDNDGDEDCFAGLEDPRPELGNELWLNDGTGHFTKKEGSGFEASIGAATAGNAVFADFDGDAKLDLFLGNGHTTIPSRNQLYLGNGDGSFTEVSERLRGDDTLRMTNGLVTCDYDNDGDLDVFASTYGVSVELGHNQLWRNDGTGSFDQVGEESGFAAQATGNYWLESTGHGTLPEPDAIPASWVGSNGFGVDCQDVNGDGLPDVYLAAISHSDEADASRKWSDPSQLLINHGPDAGFTFTNEFLASGLPYNEGDIDNAIIDFDNDGLMDLAVGRDKKYETGYRKEYVDQKAWFGLFHRRSDGIYDSVGLTSGINDPNDASAVPRLKAAGSQAWSDIDHDGDLDLLVGGGAGHPAFLFSNEIGSKNPWLGIRLRGDGVHVNRDAIGARVTVTVRNGDRRTPRMLVREVKSSRGTYDSLDSRALLFGLGELSCEPGGDGSLDAEAPFLAISVRWPNARVQRVPVSDLARNRYLQIAYDESLLSPL